MARRRKRTRKTEVRENGPELLWILAGLGVLGAGTVVYLATRPPATTTPSSAAVQAATQARLNAIEANIADQGNAEFDELGGASASANAPSNGGSTGPVNTGNSDIDNAANSAINNATGQATDAANSAAGQASDAVNSAASQLGF